VIAEAWLQERERLVRLAYRMLGSLAEAEDVASEAYLRLRRAGEAGTAVNDPAAWLTTATVRLALDVLRSARLRREAYVGPWLPEPLATGRDPADEVALAESLSVALLVVLETLSPLERAVFVLREVFAFDHAAIAAMLERSEPAVRQTARRARAHVAARRPRFEPDRDRRAEVAQRFLDACTGGSVTALVEVLSDGVVMTSDGGGAVSAARKPIEGRDRVAGFVAGLLRQATGRETFRLAEVNAAPAVLIVEDGELTGVYALQVVDGRVGAIHALRNPAKLSGLLDQLG